jgi:hypothetical protein
MHRPAATLRPFHSIAWLVWSLAAAACVELAPSPVYVALVIGIAWLMVEAHAPDGPYRRAFPALIALGVVFGLIRVVIATLTTHTGIHVLMTLPQFTMPDILGGFTIGGSVEAGVILQSLASSFTVVGVMAVFGAVNAIWSHYELVQSAPRAFHELGVVITVALAFVPATIESIGAVREADRARTGGHVVRRGRLLRSALPVLERGMERSVALSESMDARGFGAGVASHADVRSGWLSLVAMGALAGMFVALIGREPVAALICATAGVAFLLAAVVSGSRGIRRQHYRRRRLAAADLVMISAALVSPLVLGVLSATGNATLAWYASPLVWPRFDLIVALAFVPLLAPLLSLPTPAPAPATASTRTLAPDVLITTP